MGIKALRHLRFASFIQQELSHLILEKAKDDRLKNVVITHVKVTKDLKQAKVYVRSLTGEVDSLLPVLKHATPFLEKQLGPLLHTKSMPRLLFFKDDNVEMLEKIETLLSEEDL